MDSNKISNTAVLMPTYGRPDAIYDTLNSCLETYKKYNFDVYIFDSNGNDETRDLIYDLQKQYNNLYYIRLCEFIHLDCKWLDMIRGKYLKKNYDYIYPCGDANSLTEYSLVRIYPYLLEGVDIVNICDMNRISKTKRFNTPDSYYNSPNYNIGQWGGAIYNYKRIFNLNDEEWNIAIGKWFKKDLEYIGLNGFILERISLCTNLNIVEPSMDGVEPNIVMRRSIYKKSSFWRKDAIMLLGVTYPKVYRMLPKCYSNCDKKIKRLLLDNFNEDYFWFLKRNYKFNIKDYFFYKKIFDKECVKILNIKIFLMSVFPGRKFFYKIIQKI